MTQHIKENTDLIVQNHQFEVISMDFKLDFGFCCKR